MTISMSGLDLDFLRKPGDDPTRGVVMRIDHRPKRKNPFADKRSDLPMPGLVLDRIEYRSTIDGTMITSRNQHRDHMKEHGCIEYEKFTGETSKEKVRKELKRTLAEDLKKSYAQAEAGYQEGPAVEDAALPSVDVPDNVQNGDLIRAEVPAD